MKKKLRDYQRRQQRKGKATNITFFFVFATFIIFFLVTMFMRKTGVEMPFLPKTGGTPYVSANGTKLYVNGELYQFTGINAFNLGTYPGANAGCGSKENNLDGLFAKLRPNSMVRTWAFQGSITTNPTTKQTDWTGLDRVVAAASKNNVKLILVLGNQAGTCDDGHWKDKAWYEEGYKEAMNDYGNDLTPLPYLDYVKLVVDRYKNSTTIAMWEPINEPEAADCKNGKGTACYANQTCDEPRATKALRSFFDDVGETIKSIDKNHLVSSGVIGDGQCGAVYEDYKYIHESPGIDVASYHDYGRDDQPMPGDIWNGLQKRLNQMKLVNKPLIVGEVGMQATDNSSSCVSLSARQDKMKAKMDTQFTAGIAGFMPWALSNGTSPICNYDIGNNDPTLDLLHSYPVSMGTVQNTQAPIAPTELKATSNAPNQVTLTWAALSDNAGVVRYDIFRNDTYLTSTTGTSFTNTNLSPGTTYTYHIKGKDVAGNNSESSNRVTITPEPDTQAPNAPTILTAVSPNQVTLTWAASSDNVGVVRYDIFRNDTYLTSTTTTSFTNTNLSPGTTYTYHIKGKDAAGNNSESSNRVTIRTTSQP